MIKNKNLKQSFIFIFLVLGLSYIIFWEPIALFKLRTANLIEGKIYNIPALIFFFIGGFVPSLVGIILTRYFEGKEGIKKLFFSAIDYRIGVSFFIIIIVYGTILGSLQLILYMFLRGSFNFSQFIIQLPTILPLIFLGPLSEEFGWRGFLQKRINSILSPIAGSIIIGFVWSLWHLPLFYMIGTSQHDFHIPFIPFMIYLISSSLIYTYLYNKSKGSLFVALLFHWITSYIFQVINSQISRSTTYNFLECLPVLIVGCIFVILVKNQRTAIKGEKI
jgi:uncharacterized protein